MTFAPKYNAERNLLFARIREIKPDELITYDELRQIAGMDVQRQHYNILKSVINRYMNEFDELLIKIQGVGIKIANNEEKIKLGQRNTKTIKKRARQTLKETRTIHDFQNLSENQRCQANAIMVQNAFICTSLDKKRTKLLEEACKTDELPYNKTLELFKD